MQSETKVTDLYQSAYLLASGCEFPRVVFERGSAAFLFPDTDALVAWHLEAWKLDHGNEGEELLMPVKKFTNSIRKLKSAMAAAQREKGSTCVQQRHSR
jgi:hypothetical protein